MLRKYILEMKRKIVLILCFLTFALQGVSQTQHTLCAASASEHPACVKVNGGKFHVQGLAYDEQAQCMYFSFTSAFFKTDMKGQVIASIADINGHIGAMTFDKKSRRVLASLEMKDDAIGRNIARKLGQEAWSREQAGFYLAVIDVDRLTRMDMKQEEVMTLVRLDEVCNDYQANVNDGDKVLEHRFACSGIDGVTIAPAFGEQNHGSEVIMKDRTCKSGSNNCVQNSCAEEIMSSRNSNCGNISCTRNCGAEVASKGRTCKSGSNRCTRNSGAEVASNVRTCSCASNSCAQNCGEQQCYVYVAYGVYGDTTRTDNDYNVLLAYRLEDVLAQAGMSSSPSANNVTCSITSVENANVSPTSDSYARKYGIQQLCHVHKYFVHTGNTEWGVQNLAYDSSTNKMFLAVYKGSKSRWPNYDLFALDMHQQAFPAPLEGVPYSDSPVEQLEVSGAWYFRWGSTGLCPLGDGTFYISHNGASDGNNYCEARRYRWQGSSSPEISPFVPAADEPSGGE